MSLTGRARRGRHSPTSKTPPGRSPASPIARRSSPRARSMPAPARAVLQVRKPPARRRLQVPRRLQRAVAPLRRRAARAASSPSPPAITPRRSPSPARLLDIPRVIVMPSDAPAVKRARHRGYGGEVVLYDRERDDAKRSAGASREERGLTLIPPYDHADVIAGAGHGGARAVRRSRLARCPAGPLRRRRTALRRGISAARPRPRTAASSASNRRPETMRRDRSGPGTLQTVAQSRDGRRRRAHAVARAR